MNQREGQPINVTGYGSQSVRTRVYWVLPEETQRLNIADLLQEARAEVGGEPQEEAWVLS
jgi:hypothetical protein